MKQKMDAEHLEILKRSPLLNAHEKELLLCLEGEMTGWWPHCLYEAIQAAPPGDRRLLACVYPGEVKAWEAWASGDLQQRCEQAVAHASGVAWSAPSETEYAT